MLCLGRQRPLEQRQHLGRLLVEHQLLEPERELALDEAHARRDVVERDGVLPVEQHLGQELRQSSSRCRALPWQPVGIVEDQVVHVAVQHELRRLPAQVAAAQLVGPGGQPAGFERSSCMSITPCVIVGLCLPLHRLEESLGLAGRLRATASTPSRISSRRWPSSAGAAHARRSRRRAGGRCSPSGPSGRARSAGCAAAPSSGPCAAAAPPGSSAPPCAARPRAAASRTCSVVAPDVGLELLEVEARAGSSS